MSYRSNLIPVNVGYSYRFRPRRASDLVCDGHATRPPRRRPHNPLRGLIARPAPVTAPLPPYPEPLPPPPPEPPTGPLPPLPTFGSLGLMGLLLLGDHKPPIDIDISTGEPMPPPSPPPPPQPAERIERWKRQ